MKKNHFSLHFQTTNQHPYQVFEKFEKWYDETGKHILNDKCEGDQTDAIMHHCFLTQEKFEKDIKPFINPSKAHVIQETLDYLESHGEQKNWSETGMVLNDSRSKMLNHVLENSGFALFIGDIIDGVKQEFEIATQIGVQRICID